MNRLTPAGLCLALCLTGPNPLWGQVGTYVGVEAALFEDQNSIGEDSGGILSTLPTRAILVGINVRRTFHPKWFFETGVYYKQYYQSVTFEPSDNYSYPLYSFPCLQVPIRVGYKIRLTDRLSLNPEPGISMGFNIVPENGGFGGGTNTISGSTIAYDAIGTHPSRFFVLINPVIALERTFFDSLLISLYVGKSWGLTEISELMVDYTIDNSPSYRGTIVNEGNFIYGGVRVRYRISRK